MTKIFLLFNLMTITLWSYGQQKTESFKLAGMIMEVRYTPNNYSLVIEPDHLSDNLQVANLQLISEGVFSPLPITITWSLPSNNIAGYWSSGAFLDKTITPDWGPAKVTSMLAREAPVICLLGYDDTNQQTFAVSDALNTVELSTAVREENGMIYNQIKLFTEPHAEISEYNIQLRLDTRPVHFSQALREVSQWWQSHPMYQPSEVLEAAKLPVYSTWYSYHQNLTSEAIFEECKLANGMGYETVIVDDGWQTLDNSRGYAYTGDWQPQRLKDIGNLVEKVHELGMKFVLWYAVPFVGEKSEAFHQLEGKFLDYWEGQGAYVLDPRYPESRAFIINTYIIAVEEWNLDGFKLDFIGRFRAQENTSLTAEDGRDYASVNLATDRLMSDLMLALRKVKPEIMIEFRQPYAGPLMRKYGNMLRATDCPNVAILNRVETTDLKMLSGKTAVHSDMLMWHYQEPVEKAALQFLNVLFSVPQISVRLEDIPEDHVKMIKFYSNYWLENREVLLDGVFKAYSPLLNYPMLESTSAEKRITVLYEDRTVHFQNTTGKSLDIVNAKFSDGIVLKVAGTAKEFDYQIFNVMGQQTDRQQLTLNPGVYSFDVPASGIVQFTPISND